MMHVKEEEKETRRSRLRGLIYTWLFMHSTACAAEEYKVKWDNR